MYYIALLAKFGNCCQWRIQGGGNTGHIPPPLELSNALLLGHGLAVATYISLTSHLLPPESRLLASYTRTDRSCVNNIMWPHPPLFYIVKMCPPPLLKILNPPLAAAWYGLIGKANGRTRTRRQQKLYSFYIVFSDVIFYFHVLQKFRISKTISLPVCLVALMIWHSCYRA